MSSPALIGSALLAMLLAACALPASPPLVDPGAGERIERAAWEPSAEPRLPDVSEPSSGLTVQPGGESWRGDRPCGYPSFPGGEPWAGDVSWPLETGRHPLAGKGWVDRLCEAPTVSRELFWDFTAGACNDLRHYYSADNLTLLALGVAVAAPLANTSADGKFRDWYQREVRSPGLDRWSEVAKVPGDHFLLVPLFVGAWWVGGMYEDTATGSVLHAWGLRTARAALVGAPSVGILQYGLGASRPEEKNSHWHPFRDTNGVAGHGFIGAVPFLAAASLTENPWLRYPLFAASFATDWSRINDDSHYLSQAVLGWWIAYLSVRSVEASDRERQSMYILPAPHGEALGVSVLFRY